MPLDLTLLDRAMADIKRDILQSGRLWDQANWVSDLEFAQSIRRSVEAATTESEINELAQPIPPDLNSCGSSYCVAGLIAVRYADPEDVIFQKYDIDVYNYKLDIRRYKVVHTPFERVRATPEETSAGIANHMSHYFFDSYAMNQDGEFSPFDGDVVTSEQRAIRLLGISQRDADILFHHSNSFWDLEAMTAELHENGNMNRFDLPGPAYHEEDYE